MNLSCKWLDGGYTVDTHGRVKPCCIIKGRLQHPLWSTGDHQQSKFWKQLRSNLDAGIRDSMCDRCWIKEDMGEESMRQRASTWEDVTPWRYLDLKLGNLCNLQCRMCHASNSSQITKEIKNNIDEDWPVITRKYYENTIRQDLTWFTNPKFYDQIKEHADQVQVLKFTGGEPTLISHVDELIQWFVDSGHADHTKITITTNGTNIKHQLFENMQKFKKCTLNVSCDGVGKVYEYIRYPHKWKQFEKNMEYIKTHFDIPITYAFALIPYNLFDIINFNEWFETNKKEGSTWSLTPVTRPEFMDVRNLPEDMIQRAIEYLSKYDNKQCKLVLKFLFLQNKFKQGTIKELINHTNILDRLRNQSIVDIDDDSYRWPRIFKQYEMRN